MESNKMKNEIIQGATPSCRRPPKSRRLVKLLRGLRRLEKQASRGSLGVPEAPEARTTGYSGSGTGGSKNGKPGSRSEDSKHGILGARRCHQAVHRDPGGWELRIVGGSADFKGLKCKVLGGFGGGKFQLLGASGSDTPRNTNFHVRSPRGRQICRDRRPPDGCWPRGKRAAEGNCYSSASWPPTRWRGGGFYRSRSRILALKDFALAHKSPPRVFGIEHRPNWPQRAPRSPNPGSKFPRRNTNMLRHC